MIKDFESRNLGELGDRDVGGFRGGGGTTKQRFKLSFPLISYTPREMYFLRKV